MVIMKKILKAIGKKITNNFRRTWLNKLVAVAMVAVTALGGVWTGDAGPMVFSLMFIGIPLIFAKENIFTD